MRDSDGQIKGFAAVAAFRSKTPALPHPPRTERCYCSPSEVWSSVANEMAKDPVFINILIGAEPLQPHTVITNIDGNRVWLKESFTPHGKLVGVIDCCPVLHPCPRHRAVAAAGRSAVARA